MADGVIGLVMALVILVTSSFILLKELHVVRKMSLKVFVNVFGLITWALGWWFLWLGIAVVQYRVSHDMGGWTTTQSLPPLWWHDIWPDMYWVFGLCAAACLVGVAAYLIYVLNRKSGNVLSAT